MKKFLMIALALVLAFALCACGNEPSEPQKPESPAETPSEPEVPEEPEVIPEEPSEPKKTPEEIAENCGYMTFEEITAAGYYPDWMQPHTIIIYDENGVPEITEGAELTPEDLVDRPEFDVMPFIQFSEEMKIEPNTKAEYDLHGFIQNIYHLWPDGNYNLDYPPEEG
ncbi:MAG: hypothetical protein J6J15_06015 [Oscillospiraceae bacterium]|nr:hypothetical protein [Oscillospiraceae bacterium]